MITLSKEQCSQLDQPVPTAHDPTTNKTYVLVPEAVFERFRAVLFGELDVTATGELVERIMADDDANDPYLEEYQAYTRREAR
jgi:hypothetical protein